jgi:hypothetical protein
MQVTRQTPREPDSKVYTINCRCKKILQIFYVKIVPSTCESEALWLHLTLCGLETESVRRCRPDLGCFTTQKIIKGQMKMYL